DSAMRERARANVCELPWNPDCCVTPRLSWLACAGSATTSGDTSVATHRARLFTASPLLDRSGRVSSPYDRVSTMRSGNPAAEASEAKLEAQQLAAARDACRHESTQVGRLRPRIEEPIPNESNEIVEFGW